MTPEEALSLASFGMTVRYRTIQSIVNAALWGIHLAFTLAALGVTWKHGLKRRSAKIIFTSLIVLFFLATFVAINTFIFDVYWIGYLSTAKNHELTPLEQGAAIAAIFDSHKLWKAWFFFDSPASLVTLTGDVVILWRGWMIWQHRKIWLIPPIFLFICALALTLTSNILALTFVTTAPPRSNPIGVTALTSLSCSVVSNLIMTIMIGYQAYKHHLIWAETMGTRRHSAPWKILLFLTEAGVLYFCVQLVHLALTSYLPPPNSPADYAFGMWLKVTCYVAATYPAILVLIVMYNKSLVPEAQVSSSGPTASSRTQMSFRAPNKTEVNTTTSTLRYHHSEGTIPLDEFKGDKSWEKESQHSQNKAVSFPPPV